MEWAVRFKTPTSEDFRYCIEDGEIKPFGSQYVAESFAGMCRESFGEFGNVYEVVPYPKEVNENRLRVGYKRGEKWTYKNYFPMNKEDANRLLDDLRAAFMDCERITLVRQGGFKLNG